MQYFKTIGVALSFQFEQDGEKSDNGQPIKATEQPMTEDEYRAYKTEVLRNKMERLERYGFQSELVYPPNSYKD